MLNQVQYDMKNETPMVVIPSQVLKQVQDLTILGSVFCF